jgi:hypothetical protein
VFVSMFIFVMSRHIFFSRKLRMTFRTIRRVARIKMIYFFYQQKWTEENFKVESRKLRQGDPCI